ncbi:Beta-tubulin folding cofactor E [Ceraceosorus bombacis]|uniref:Beta-tubulin folding cofactor E n=1 Tax=Ceraceosorus bombacis TaxID=401625 RepID=A0A0P1B9R1_9BASI|nr:Beta-tubulin folding cofactor E [Ceraceosorus bombacis]
MADPDSPSSPQPSSSASRNVSSFHSLPLGTRLVHRSTNQRCTVRYVGAIPPTLGQWWGVEWDDPLRGKHSGTYVNPASGEAKQYFTCRLEGAGSFVRPDEPGKPPKFARGVSFLKALRAKYAPDLRPPQIQEQDKVQYTRKNLADIEIETPNMDGVIRRVGRLDKLREVGLGGWKGSTSGGQDIDMEAALDIGCAFDESSGEKPGDIARICPNIRSLDLSRSLLPTWKDVAFICRELRQLNTLILHFNRFEPHHSEDARVLQGAFDKVTDLRLDGTLIGWSEILFLSKHFPSLETLQIGSNALDRLSPSGDVQSLLDPPHQAFPHLRQLNLSSNNLGCWSDIYQTLRDLPALQRLYLSDNRIGRIAVPPDFGAGFPTLQHLTLTDNPVNEWRDLEALDDCVKGAPRHKDAAAEAETTLRGLRSLTLAIRAGSVEYEASSANEPRGTRNDKDTVSPQSSLGRLTDLQPGDIRPSIIARLPRLEMLNGSPISSSERKDAERWYIGHVQRQLTEADDEQRTLYWRRYARLVQEHGAPSSLPDAAKTTSTLGSKLLELRIQASLSVPIAHFPHTTPTSIPDSTMRVLRSTPIRQLRNKLAKQLKISGGATAIESVWAMLAEAAHPDETAAEAGNGRGGVQERIVFELDDVARQLSWYQLSSGDSIIVVIDSP